MYYTDPRGNNNKSTPRDTGADPWLCTCVYTHCWFDLRLSDKLCYGLAHMFVTLSPNSIFEIGEH